MQILQRTVRGPIWLARTPKGYVWTPTRGGGQRNSSPPAASFPMDEALEIVRRLVELGFDRNMLEVWS